MMEPVTGSFQNADSLNIHTIQWLPTASPKAIIVIVHGIAEHSGRYRHVAEYLAENGYAVYSLDHRGHGRSGGQPRSYFDSFDQPVADLKQYVDAIAQEHPGAKIFLYGHSMGAFISLNFAMRYQDRLAGLITSGSPLTIDTTVPRFMMAIGNILVRIAPRLPLIKLDLQAISRDQAVIDAYNADPLIDQTPVRVRMAVSYNNALKRLRASLSELTLPLLLLHGSADTLAPVSGSEIIYEKAGSTDKTLKIYEGLYHEVHNESEQAAVLQNAVHWLDARCA